MMEKFKVLFFVLVGVVFFTLLDGVMAEAAEYPIDTSVNADMVEDVDISAYIEDYPYYLAYYNTANSKLHFYFSTVPLTVVTDDVNAVWEIWASAPYMYKHGYTTDKGATWSFFSSSAAVISPNKNCSLSFDYPIYSNHDIVEKDTTNVVFQAPPEPSPLVKVAAAIQPGTVLKEILAMVPLLILLLAGYLGLRKALKFLSQILRTA